VLKIARLLPFPVSSNAIEKSFTNVYEPSEYFAQEQRPGTEVLRRREISYKPTITVFTSIRKRKSVNARVMSLLLYRPEYMLRNQALRN